MTSPAGQNAGTSPFWLLPLFFCLVLNIAMRSVAVWSSPCLNVLVGHRISDRQCELVTFVNDCQEIVACTLVIISVLVALHALSCDSLQHLSGFASDLSAVHQLETGKRPRFQSCGHSEESDDMISFSSGDSLTGCKEPECKHYVHAKEEKIKHQYMRSVLRMLAVSPLIYLITLAVYIIFHENHESENWTLPPALSTMSNHVLTSKVQYAELLLFGGYIAMALQIMSFGLYAIRVFHDVNMVATSAMVNKLDNLFSDDEDCLEDGAHICTLGVLLIHHIKFCDEMVHFWGRAEAGTSVACIIAVCFSLNIASGLNILILNAPKASGLRHADDTVYPHVGQFVVGASLLVMTLHYLASITDACTSTKPNAASIIAATRRYINCRLVKDTERKVRGVQGMSTADRHELLSAGLTVECRSVGVYLMGIMNVSYGLAATTLLRLMIYAPVGLSFISAWLLSLEMQVGSANATMLNSTSALHCLKGCMSPQ